MSPTSMARHSLSARYRHPAPKAQKGPMMKTRGKDLMFLAVLVYFIGRFYVKVGSLENSISL